MPKKRVCPTDKSRLSKVDIVWGLVDLSDFHAPGMKSQRVIFGGCCLPFPTPRWGWLCLKCGWSDYEGKSETDYPQSKSRIKL